MDIFAHLNDYCCPVCQPSGIPTGFSTWFRVRPESAQALHNLGAGEKARYENAIRAEIAKHNYQMTWGKVGHGYPLNTFDPHNVYGKRGKNDPPVQRDVCVALLFGLTPGCPDKDVDNMAKLFLDALKGKDGLVHDDKAVVHLEVLKRVLVPSTVTGDNYLVGVRISLVSTKVKREANFTWSGAVPPVVI